MSRLPIMVERDIIVALVLARATAINRHFTAIKEYLVDRGTSVAHTAKVVIEDMAMHTEVATIADIMLVTVAVIEVMAVDTEAAVIEVIVK